MVRIKGLFYQKKIENRFYNTPEFKDDFLSNEIKIPTLNFSAT